jgi:hypothetical protein
MRVEIADSPLTGIVLLLGTGMSYTATARDIHVCATCAHTSIQSAVNDAAAAGDVIDIEAGRYTENIIIDGKQLTLQGATGGANGTTEVYAAGQGPVLALGSGVAGATPELIEIHNLVIAQGNHTGGTGVGGGIQVRAGAYLHLYDSTLTQNLAVQGGGLGVNSPGAPQTVISGCLIDDNTASGTFVRGGGGIAVLAGSAVSIQASTLTHNGSHAGGGVFSDTSTQLTITDSILSSNTSTAFGTKVGPSGGDGGGLEASGSLSITGSSFVNNIADGEGGGGGGLALFLNPGAPQLISNTIIARNSLTTDEPEGLGGGIVAAGGFALPHSVLTLSSVYVVENTAQVGGGIFTADVTLSLTDTTVKDNIGAQICDNDTGCH